MTTQNEALDMACLVAVVGSRAYGLNHADSDTDHLGVFIAPSTEVAGLDWTAASESWSNASPNGDDMTMYEIGKFLKLALGGNPTLIELLFMNDYDILTEEGERMVELRNSIVSEKRLRASYHGYAKSQFMRIKEDNPYKEKMARHALRIARQGRSLLETARFDVRVDNPQEYFDLTELPKEEMLKVIERELYMLETCESVIPEYPDRESVVDFLRSIRYDNP